jgi:mannan endo-1,4-beta-mannosidase
MNIKHTLLVFSLCLNFQLFSQTSKLSDPDATSEAAKLYKNLQKLPEKGYLVGHQDALAYGVNWKYQKGASDIKGVTGDNPGLYGWEIGHIENGTKMNLDSVPFDKMKSFIKEGYQRGSVITISWHGDNPLTGKSAWDPAAGSVASVLPGASRHDFFLKQLDKVADFLTDLKGRKGELIPILFRPFHELTGDWFWWGTKSSSPGEFKELFRFSVDYLRSKKNLHNLVIVYNTGGEFKSEAEFLERYPGDEYVDIISFDTYQGSAQGEKTFVHNLKFHLSIIESVGKKRGKIPAVGEIGFNKIPSANWFTKTIRPALQDHKFAYLLLWRNAGYKPKENAMEYYVPYKGHPAATDFINYYSAPETLFEKDAARLKLYK